MKKYNSGISGEKKVKHLLEVLENQGYKIFHNLKLPMKNGKKIELDFIVIGMNGVFIVEVKNLQGVITGHTTHKHLKRFMPNSGTYQDIENPIKQIGKQAKYLSNYFNENNIFTDIDYIIVFPNEDVQIDLIGDTSKILYSYQLTNYINSYSSIKILTYLEISNIYKILKGV